jgi:hypothetical protein
MCRGYRPAYETLTLSQASSMDDRVVSCRSGGHDFWCGHLNGLRGYDLVVRHADSLSCGQQSSDL